jgi:hypothetical protein
VGLGEPFPDDPIPVPEAGGEGIGPCPDPAGEHPVLPPDGPGGGAAVADQGEDLAALVEDGTATAVYLLHNHDPVPGVRPLEIQEILPAGTPRSRRFPNFEPGRWGIDP